MGEIIALSHLKLFLHKWVGTNALARWEFHLKLKNQKHLLIHVLNLTRNR